LKPKNLLDHLCDMEAQLVDFSYENFTAEEAERVRKSFLVFKNTLYNTINPSENLEHKEYLKTSPLPENQSGDFDMQTYDAVVRHYESYNSVLKSLKIDAPMKSEIYSSIFSGSTPTQTSNRPYIDLQPILDDCMGEMELLDELLHLYEKNALEFIGQAKIHIQNTDYDRLKLAAHKIKAGLAMLNTNDLYTIINQIEQTCKTDNDPKHLQFLYNCFVTEFPAVQKALHNAYEDLKKLNQ